MSHVTLKFDEWRYSPETVKLGFDLCDLHLWPLIIYMDITFVNGNNSWKFQDDTMTGTLWKMCDGLTSDGQKCSWSQLKIPYDHQAAILKVMSVKNNMYLPTATTHMHTKFETEIPKQTWVTLQKPCHLQSLQTKNPIWLPDNHFENACHGCELALAVFP